jgi:putative ABC transport system permease protein
VRDIKVRGLERTNEPQLYLPSSQVTQPIGGLYVPKDLLIRTSAPLGSMATSVRQIVRQVDPEQPVSDIRLLSEVVSNQMTTRRAQLNVLGALAFVALLLTGVGIHGLLAYTVAQRSHEIGVRLALGAEPTNVARMIVGEAARLAMWGAVPGLLLAYAAGRAMNALLFGVGPGDPATIAAGVTVVMLVTVAGSMIPALRAVRVSPMLAMRAE